jgi:hypothetical protein
MSCVARKWAKIGSTTTDKPSNAALAKEMNDRLKDIQEARNTMDASWIQQKDESVTALIVSEKKGQVAVPIFDRLKTRGF